ncbi:uncharacterized protein LOC126235883 [Schistocerca nitens]|uniref:uncharacterized protein LOC126235883 n=1 Tax=Schistocerca nitens TaxID=7011 RepID=UPI002118C924|nr:uncharacterized protein LOC126235883 [Schistocerca nitens]
MAPSAKQAKQILSSSACTAHDGPVCETSQANTQQFCLHRARRPRLRNKPSKHSAVLSTPRTTAPSAKQAKQTLSSSVCTAHDGPVCKTSQANTQQFCLHGARRPRLRNKPSKHSAVLSTPRTTAPSAKQAKQTLSSSVYTAHDGPVCKTSQANTQQFCLHRARRPRLRNKPSKHSAVLSAPRTTAPSAKQAKQTLSSSVYTAHDGPVCETSQANTQQFCLHHARRPRLRNKPSKHSAVLSTPRTTAPSAKQAKQTLSSSVCTTHDGPVCETSQAKTQQFCLHRARRPRLRNKPSKHSAVLSTPRTTAPSAKQAKQTLSSSVCTAHDGPVCKTSQANTQQFCLHGARRPRLRNKPSKHSAVLSTPRTTAPSAKQAKQTLSSSVYTAHDGPVCETSQANTQQFCLHRARRPRLRNKPSKHSAVLSAPRTTAPSAKQAKQTLSSSVYTAHDGPVCETSQANTQQFCLHHARRPRLRNKPSKHSAVLSTPRTTAPSAKQAKQTLSSSVCTTHDGPVCETSQANTQQFCLPLQSRSKHRDDGGDGGPPQRPASGPARRKRDPPGFLLLLLLRSRILTVLQPFYVGG